MNFKLEMVKTINVFLINREISLLKLANMRGYELTTSGQNFMEIHLA